MEDFFLNQIVEAGKLFLNSINWLFMVVFMLVTWLVNFGSQHPTKGQWLNWITKIPQTLFVLIFGVIIAVAYAYLNDLRAKSDIAGLLYAIIFGMVIYKLGINKFEAWVKKRLWNKPE